MCLLFFIDPSVNGQIVKRIISIDSHAVSTEAFFIDSSSTIDYDYYDVSYWVSHSDFIDDIVKAYADRNDTIFNIDFIYSSCYTGLLRMTNNRLTASIKQRGDTFDIQLCDPNKNLLLRGKSTTFFPFTWAGKLMTYYSNGRRKKQKYYGDKFASDQNIWTKSGVLLDSVF